MNLDPQTAMSTIETGIAPLSAFIVSYSLSAVGAILLLIAGHFVADLGERSVSAALMTIRGIDVTMRRPLQHLATTWRTVPWSSCCLSGQPPLFS